jgi:hypothetical protein
MRSLGNTIFLLLVALFGFGFLLAYSFNLMKELTDTKGQLTQMQAEMQALQIQYQTAVDEKNKLTEQVSGLISENTALQIRVRTLEAEHQALTGNIEALQMQLDLVEKAHPLLAWLVSTSQGHITTALLVVPVVPLSLAAMYIMVHPKTTNPYIPANRLEKGQTTIRTALTREEFHLIAQYRRSLALSGHMPGLGDKLKS